MPNTLQVFLYSFSIIVTIIVNFRSSTNPLVFSMALEMTSYFWTLDLLSNNLNGIIKSINPLLQMLSLLEYSTLVTFFAKWLTKLAVLTSCVKAIAEAVVLAINAIKAAIPAIIKPTTLLLLLKAWLTSSSTCKLFSEYQGPVIFTGN